LIAAILFAMTTMRDPLDVGPIKLGESSARVVREIGPNRAVSVCKRGHVCTKTFSYRAGVRAVMLDFDDDRLSGVLICTRTCVDVRGPAIVINKNVAAWRWLGSSILGPAPAGAPAFVRQVEGTDVLFRNPTTGVGATFSPSAFRLGRE